jgi:hypothetical protein
MAGLRLNLRRIYQNNNAARMRKPPTIPPTIPPIAPPERPLLPELDGVFDAAAAVATGVGTTVAVEVITRAAEELDVVARTVIVSRVGPELVLNSVTPLVVSGTAVYAKVMSATGSSPQYIPSSTAALANVASPPA